MTDNKVLPDISGNRRALLLYTSGTTGTPKGVVITHGNLQAQILSLVSAWEWVANDRILLVLPLHHVHGIVNVLLCALWSGACCDMRESFDADDTWERLVDTPITLFMAVPTVYRRLLAAWEASQEDSRTERSDACRRLRLMVSGSAALPVSLLELWQDVSGHVLLERYGMTEIGMALSNPLHGKRIPGSVGAPLPGVETRIVDEQMNDVTSGSEGELLVRGRSVFLEYWQDLEETREAFHDDWFRTGDVVIEDNGRYRVLGRLSSDIIKTGGYKVSALEIEEVLRSHPGIGDVAVLGVPDDEWGERVIAVFELSPGKRLEVEELKSWARDQIAPYKIPRTFHLVSELPRNSMGKVTKKELKRQVNTVQLEPED